MEPAAGVCVMQWIDASTGPDSNHAAVSTQKDNKPKSAAAVDNSLTSLNWLPEFKIPSIEGKERSDVQAKLGAAQSYVSNSDSASSTGSVTQESEVERDECFLPLSPIKRCLNQTAEFEKDPLRFEENPNKPPFSYTTIIYLAIRSCNKEKVMLSDIYQWIRDHFKYYRIAESTWQNSVRHNLSLNQFFRKIPRGESDPGKGSFWQINPEYEHLLNNDHELHRLVQQQNCVKPPIQRKRPKSRKKSNSCSIVNSVGKQQNNGKKCREKRSQSTAVSSPPVDPCHLPGDLDWVSLLSSQKVGCISCNETHHCRPSFGSPVLGMLDLGHIGEPVTCSPAVLPVSLQSKIPDTPPLQQKTVLCSSLEEIITTQESPAPLLPPWAAESRPYSPNLEHPWAETGCSTHEVSPLIRRGHWSPTEVMWSPSNPQINSTNKVQIPQLI